MRCDIISMFEFAGRMICLVTLRVTTRRTATENMKTRKEEKNAYI